MSGKHILITALIILFIAGGFVVWQWVFRESESSVSSSKAEVEINASDLLEAYQMNEDSANNLYLGKVILVTGRVDGYREDSATVSVYVKDPGDLSGVTCVFDPSVVEVSDIIEGQYVKIKGSCSGYLLDVVLNKCVMVE